VTLVTLTKVDIRPLPAPASVELWDLCVTVMVLQSMMRQGREESAAKEVMALLDRARKETAGGPRRAIPDPFKDLLEFISTSEEEVAVLEIASSPEKEEVVEVYAGNTEEKEHVCLFCQKTFDRVTKLSSHMKAAHTEAEQRPGGPEAAPQEPDLAWTEVPGSSYQCLVCLASLPWRRVGLEQHLLAHKLSLVQYHGVFGPAILRQLGKEQGKEVLGKEVGKQQGKELGKEVPAGRGKRTEERRGKKEFECAVCKVEFEWTEPRITEHLKEKHCLTKEFYFSLYVRGAKSAEDKFNCDKCMFISTRKSALSFHVNKYHTEGEKRTCCKKKFNTKWDLFVHLIENHRDDKDLFAKFDIWQSLEKYYLKTGS
jgi:hypothetical protein